MIGIEQGGRHVRLQSDMAAAGFGNPSERPLARASCKLYCATLMGRRDDDLACKAIVRYLNPDVSPIGRELYVAKISEVWERRVR